MFLLAFALPGAAGAGNPSPALVEIKTKILPILIMPGLSV
jgi:hypothetical protein